MAVVPFPRQNVGAGGGARVVAQWSKQELLAAV